MEQEFNPFDALKSAVDLAGSQSALARICGVGQPAVWKWMQSSKRLPAEHVLRVEAATGVSRHVLRPDIYPLDHIAPPTDAAPSEDCATLLPIARAAGQSNRKPVFDRRAAAA